MTIDDERRPPLPAWIGYIIPAAIAVLALAVMAGGLLPMLALRYDRDAILAGEVWRLLSGHLVHLNWNHLLLNLGGLALIWVLFGARLAHWQWGIVIVVSALGVGLGLLFAHPQLAWYVGLSGLLHGMFVAGAIGGLFSGYRAEWLLLALVTLKLAWEQVGGALPGTESLAGGGVIVDAHLYGALCGLAVILLLRAFRPHPAWLRR